MKFIINPHSGVPIYKQIIQQVEKGIASGMLEEGMRLPTVREVAVDLAVNPNTVARAYRELEHQELVVTEQGRGSFIAVGVEKKVAAEELMTKLVDDFIEEARQLNFSPDRLKELLWERLEKARGGKDNG